mmetsp:Transcript_114167/g.317817  ORF Transcript_114167/g.317817 Transcript_114167/m.317817 type:complete len:253 (-) Transcript_114167:565-1323(-)
MRQHRGLVTGGNALKTQPAGVRQPRPSSVRLGPSAQCTSGRSTPRPQARWDAGLESGRCSARWAPLFRGEGPAARALPPCPRAGSGRSAKRRAAGPAVSAAAEANSSGPAWTDPAWFVGVVRCQEPLPPCARKGVRQPVVKSWVGCLPAPPASFRKRCGLARCCRLPAAARAACQPPCDQSRVTANAGRCPRRSLTAQRRSAALPRAGAKHRCADNDRCHQCRPCCRQCHGSAPPRAVPAPEAALLSSASAR